MEGGSITAAVILGAIISIVTLIIGRGSKISDLRQAWINDQRADFGKWAEAALALARHRSAISRPTDLNVFEEAAFRIRLRENPRKKEWKPVIERMDAVRTTLLNAAPNTAADIFDDLVAIAELSQDRLKKDWNKVRFGELSYRILIFFFPILFAVLFLYGYYTLFPDHSPFAGRPEMRAEQHITGSLQLLAPPGTMPVMAPDRARPPTPKSSSPKRD
jgi:hypothetical protein